jgi:RNA polymerase sigma-70 factor (ECF subfamily)
MTEDQAGRLLSELFEASYGRLVHYALWATGSLEVAEDLVQNAFMELYAALRRGERLRDPRSWLVCVLRRAVLKHRRARRKQLEIAAQASDLDALPDVTTEPVDSSAELDAFRSLFSALTRREQEVLLLRLQPLRYQEIACQLGISPNSVKTLLARAFRKLRAARTAGGLPRVATIHEEDGLPKTLQ